MENKFTVRETNICKGLAVVFLCFHHLFKQETIMEQYALIHIVPSKWLTVLAIQARMSVWIFVFLTGYGLTITIGDGFTMKKLVQRWIALMQTYWFAWFAYFITMIGLGKWNWESVYCGKISFLLFDLLGLSDLVGINGIVEGSWYFAFAAVLTFIFPLLVRLVDEFRFCSIPLMLSVPIFLQNSHHSNAGGYYIMYLPVATMGILFCKESLFSMIDEMKKGKYFFFVLSGIVSLYISVVLSKNIELFNDFGLISVFRAIIAVSVCCLAYCLRSLRLMNFFAFLGRFSADIFIFHMYILKFGPMYIYKFKEPLVVLIGLLSISLLAAVIAYFIKKYMGYNALFLWIKNRFTND